MKNCSNIVALFVCIFPVILLCSGKSYSPKNPGRLPNLQTIQDTQQSESARQKIITNGSAVIDNYYRNYYANNNDAIKALHAIDWHQYIEQLTTYAHNSLLQNHHIEAQRLLKFLQTLPQSQELDLLKKYQSKLIDCATWAAVDAIEQYNRKTNTTKPQLPADDLLPSVENLRNKIHKEITAIPKSIRDHYRNAPDHAFTQFYKKEAERRADELSTIELFKAIKKTTILSNLLK